MSTSSTPPNPPPEKGSRNALWASRGTPGSPGKKAGVPLPPPQLSQRELDKQRASWEGTLPELPVDWRR